MVTFADPPTAVPNAGPNAADDEVVGDPYTPVAWDGSHPIANSVIAKHYAAATSPVQQHEEATKLQAMIIQQDHSVFDALNSVPTPSAMLVQRTGSCKLRVIFGIAKYIGNPMAPPNGLHGQFMALGADLVSPSDTPQAILLPDDVLKTNVVEVPSDADFLSALNSKAGTSTNIQHDTTQWFKSGTAQGRATLPRAMPIPLHLAMDACLGDVTAHVLFERCKVQLEIHEGEDDSLLRAVMAFCKAAHTKHNAGRPTTTAIPAALFSERLHPDAHKWAAARARFVCPALIVQGTPPSLASTATGSPMSTTSPGTAVDASQVAINLMAQFVEQLKAAKEPAGATSDGTTADDPDKLLFDKYGLRGEDLTIYLQQCGLADGQEEELPAWKARMAAKNLSEDGKHRIAVAMLDQLRYEDHPVKPHPAILKMIMKGKFTGDGSLTAIAAMTGLTPYMLVELTDLEVTEAQEYYSALSQATATTPADIKKQSKVAKIPGSFHELADTLKRFANLLLAIFGPLCPFLCQVTSLISDMMKMDTSTKIAMDKKTIASIMWIVFKQSRRFTNGAITAAGDDTDLNWLDLRQKVATATAIHRTDLPTGINGIPLPPKPDSTKRARPDGSPPALTAPAERDVNLRYNVHPKVLSQIVGRIPQRFSIKQALDKKTLSRDFFGIPNLCHHAALYGICRSKNCKRDHDVSKVNDAAVETAISALTPLFIAADKSDTVAIATTAFCHLPVPRDVSPAPPPIMGASHTSPSPLEPQPDPQCNTETKSAPPAHIMTPDEAASLTAKAIDQRINDLPNVAGQKDLLGKKPRSLMIPRTYAKGHPAFDLLHDYAEHGCPVDCGPDWTMPQLLEALNYGAHPSAMDPIANECLRKETADKVAQNFARVQKWGELKKNLPPTLKLSPVAMIPHKSRAFRCILDLSFPLRISKTP